MIKSPYSDCPENEWQNITEELVNKFPLLREEIVRVVMESWSDLYNSSFGQGKLIVGQDIFLPAQATGVILEKLISCRLAKQYPGIWSGGSKKNHKDVVNITDGKFSFEIKTSSHPTGVYGNRSTGNRSDKSQKIRTGYYLVVNYLLPTEDTPDKKIRTIRFGWIDDDDWTGQSAASGQQASIGAKLAKLKLVTLYKN